MRLKPLTLLPGNIDVSGGTVTVAEFKQPGTAAMLAGEAGSIGDR